MTSLAELKARSKSNLEKFKEKSKPQTFERKSDERFWYPQLDDQKNGFAIIRFLPISKVDDDKPEALPWAKIYNHSFQNQVTKKWYIENSLSTFNQKDPVGEYNRELWDQGESGKEQASKQKRNLSYYSNIYVVKDPTNPENEGKFFLFRYGKKIYDKINELLNPDEAFGDESVDPFDFWTGKNFRLKIKGVKSGSNIFPNYDSSEWDSSAPIADKSGTPLTDEQIVEIYENSYSLLEFYDPKNFKSYDELKKKLNDVLGISGGDEPKKTAKEEPKQEKASSNTISDEDDDIEDLIKSSSEASDDTDDLINELLNDD